MRLTSDWTSVGVRDAAKGREGKERKGKERKGKGREEKGTRVTARMTRRSVAGAVSRLTGDAAAGAAKRRDVSVEKSMLMNGK